MISWDTNGAERELSRRAEEAARANAVKGVMCPLCGEPANAEMVDVSTPWHGYQFVPARFLCSAQCWRVSPQQYIDAVKALA